MYHKDQIDYFILEFYISNLKLNRNVKNIILFFTTEK
jgi:hypothetical protein